MKNDDDDDDDVENDNDETPIKEEQKNNPTTNVVVEAELLLVLLQLRVVDHLGSAVVVDRRTCRSILIIAGGKLRVRVVAIMGIIVGE